MAREQSSDGMIEGVCKNLPKQCELAASKQVQRVPASDPRCRNPDCRMTIRAVRKPGASRRRPILLVGGAALCALVMVGLLIGWANFGGLKDVSHTLACDPANMTSTRTADIDAALKFALGCRDSGKLNEAILVLSDLKERGSGAATLHLGELYDPLDPIQEKPDHLTPSILNAVEFYQQACGLKEPAAAAKLASLKNPAVQELDRTGDRMIAELVEKWPECLP